MTTLFNRAAFEDGLAEAIARTRRNPDSIIAMYLLDLDGFKQINDNHGHSVGDLVLQAVAARLLDNQRQGEMACRLGGDEFAVLIEGSQATQLLPLAERILYSVSQPIEVKPLTLKVGCSIGISIYPSLASNAKALMDQADIAMYQIKKNGKCGFSLYQQQSV